MPELPDVTVYVERLSALLGGRRLDHLGFRSPFVLRTVEPPAARFEGARLDEVLRIGKQIALGFEGDRWCVIHLMIAGRFRWLGEKAKPPAITLALLHFEHGRMALTEAGTKKRASVHLAEGPDALAPFRRGGLEVFEADLDAFTERLRRENHTLKRSLTDPRLFSGIGNAYSDEILHRARLSPVTLTSRLEDAEIERLFQATRHVLTEWTDLLREEVGDGFPEKVTAFREGMAVHGRYRQPCPVCGTPVQRIRYAENETNYCARCQTGGKLLADRSLSRILKKDWPRSIDELL